MLWYHFLTSRIGIILCCSSSCGNTRLWECSDQGLHPSPSKKLSNMWKFFFKYLNYYFFFTAIKNHKKKKKKKLKVHNWNKKWKPFKQVSTDIQFPYLLFYRYTFDKFVLRIHLTNFPTNAELEYMHNKSSVGYAHFDNSQLDDGYINNIISL